MGACRIVEDLDEWVSGRCFQNRLNITDHHAKCDEHDEAQSAVDNGCPNHGPWQRAGGIAQLLGHVGCGVGPDEGEDGRKHADKTGQSDVAPSTTVGEGEEDLNFPSLAIAFGSNGQIDLTSEAFDRSPSTQRGMSTAKKPTMCKTRMMPSTSGRRAARKVLNRIENVSTAQIIRVPCHLWGS